jgi:hypothetical protein
MTNLTHSSFICIYFNSLHVSSNLVLIIRRINCIQYNVQLVKVYSVVNTTDYSFIASRYSIDESIEYLDAIKL